MSIQSDDINDVFDGLREERPQEIASVSNDSNIGSSLSNFGIDRDNPEENQRYIQQNQDPQAIIQGIGVAARSPDGSVINVSGLGTSVSRTISSEFNHEVIEFQGEDVSDTNSEINAAVEPQPGPSSGVTYGYDPQYDESEKLAENLQELDISSFDLALGKGYRDQAKIYFDDAASKGSHPKTKHIQPIKSLESEEAKKQLIADGSLNLDDDLWSQGYALQRIFNLLKDFSDYLEYLQKKEFKKVLEILNNKKELNDKEKKIKKNIGTKANRNNVTLQKETITMIQDFIEYLNHFELYIRDILNSEKNQANKTEEEPSGSKPYENNEKKDNNDYDKDGASGFHQSST